ncbi:hypothetical protein DFH07DRAFT_1035629 [Mycena maculata]|uniref:Uncharacterized protein n=1 Tax=Mycena maculata TaxID=230809 RepID=A0AAD7ISJ3_9AGAR|nr:hypothetical protein DFH07DRAFT_1035629 [Mycena maculata]
MMGLDDVNIYRWELRSGRRGLLDRLPVAHTASVTSLDWCLPDGKDLGGGEGTGGLGWIRYGEPSFVDASVELNCRIFGYGISVNLIRHMPHKPTYMLHPSFPVRRVLWRPGHECEIAVVSSLTLMPSLEAETLNWLDQPLVLHMPLPLVLDQRESELDRHQICRQVMVKVAPLKKAEEVEVLVVPLKFGMPLAYGGGSPNGQLEVRPSMVALLVRLPGALRGIQLTRPDIAFGDSRDMGQALIWNVLPNRFARHNQAN